MASPIGSYLESKGVVVVLILGVLQTSFLQRQKESVSTIKDSQKLVLIEIESENYFHKILNRVAPWSKNVIISELCAPNN